MNESSPSSAKLAAPAHGGGEVVDVPLVDRAHRDDLLGEHVERVADDARRLDRARPHPLDHDRDLEQVAAVLREDLAGARLAHLVAGAPDALEAAAHRARRLHLDHEVDRAHVDAELEAAGGDERPEPAGLELVLHEQPLLACERPVVGLDQLLAGELVEARRRAARRADGCCRRSAWCGGRGSARGSAGARGARCSTGPRRRAACPASPPSARRARPCPRWAR